MTDGEWSKVFEVAHIDVVCSCGVVIFGEFYGLGSLLVGDNYFFSL